MISAGCKGAGTLSETKLYQPGCSAQLGRPLQRKESLNFRNGQYLASQHLYRLKLTYIQASLLSYTHCQVLPETVGNWKKTLLYLHCACIVRNTLEQCLQSPCCCCCFFSRSKVSMRTRFNNAGQGSAFITISWMQRMPHRVLVFLRINSGIWCAWRQLREMMSHCRKFATLNSRSQDIILMKKLKQFVTKYKMWNEVMLWFTQMRCYNVSIPLLIRQMNDAEENLNLTIFDVSDSAVIFCKLRPGWNGYVPQQNVRFLT